MSTTLWKVMPCPVNAGKHPFHDRRWVVTADAVVERGPDPRHWSLASGALICEMRDSAENNAALIVRAVNHHEQLVDVLTQITRSASVNLPHGITAYCIGRERMAEARALLESLKP